MRKVYRYPIILLIIAFILVILTIVFATGIENYSVISSANEMKGTGYYLQGANGGTVTQGSSGLWLLTFNDIIPYLLQFQENSTKNTKFIPVSDFIKNWQVKKNETAVLVLQDKNEGQNSILLSLSNPIYNEKKKTLQYSAQQLYTYDDGPLAQFIPSIRAIQEGKFGQNLLFIEYGVNSPVHSPCILSCLNNFTACNMSGNTCICSNEANACKAKCRGQNPPPPLPCPIKPPV